jgi:hypothetical protein
MEARVHRVLYQARVIGLLTPKQKSRRADLDWHVQRSLCGGSRCSIRLVQHRSHQPEAIGTKDHTANGGDGVLSRGALHRRLHRECSERLYRETLYN